MKKKPEKPMLNDFARQYQERVKKEISEQKPMTTKEAVEQFNRLRFGSRDKQEGRGTDL